METAKIKCEKTGKARLERIGMLEYYGHVNIIA
jgi:hypothetical protein